ncbi:6-carboxytetrahydropterin synthase QueD [Prolixibacteraceae bacterium Z1-6]|uniref:6-carboxy-5,6,7,8-tetrahydropterin synthase n=1 Tax=Draconibacterium aestuarii TaxID=2998507 RepID=A0A9X3J699_9BACT|nr:6-carboxytetrahydropterin synthase QueD [Prolixibacteraceae bacterium Z1-6]
MITEKTVLSPANSRNIKMSIIRVTKKFHFEMAHALYNYDGLCKNIHGHTYNLEITLLGEIRKEPGHPKDGMVIDFGNLKKLVKSNIINVFDHSLVINPLFPKEQIESMKNATERLIILDFQPTSENMVVYFAEKLQQVLPSNVSLFSIRLYETATSYAEWFASDNE